MADTSTTNQVNKKLYYGWIIVLVAGLASVAQTVYFGPVFGSFLKPITSEFGWTRSQYLGATSLGGIVGGFSSFFMGPILDKYGPKWIMLIGVALISSAIFLTAHISNITQFYMVTIMGQLGSQSMIALAISTVLPKWFVRKRGRALAFSNLGVRAGVGLHPLWVQAAIAATGWRNTLMIFSGITLVLTVIPIFFFMKRQPEDIGLFPDGEDPNSPSVKAQQARRGGQLQDRSFTLKQVLKLKSFYLLLGSFFIASFSSGGIIANIIPMLTDNGLSSSQAALIVTMWSTIGLIGTLGGGFIAERIPIKYMAAFVYAVLAMGMLVLANVHSMQMGLVFVVVHGIVWGAWNNLQIQLFADYYGRKHIGSLRGVCAPVSTVVGSIAPITLASMYDWKHSYTLILTIFMCTMLLAAFMMTLTKPPPPDYPTESEPKPA